MNAPITRIEGATTWLLLGGCAVALAIVLAPVIRPFWLRVLSIWAAAFGLSLAVHLLYPDDNDDFPLFQNVIAVPACIGIGALIARLHRPVTSVRPVVTAALVGVVSPLSAVVLWALVECGGEGCLR